MINRRTLIILLCNLMLVTFTQGVNHALSGTGIQFMTYGLLVIFPAMNLLYPHGLFVVILTGLWLDAGTATGFGMFILLLLALHFIASRISLQLHRENKSHAVMLALGANAGLFLVLALYLGHPHGYSPTYLGRVGVDFLCSNLLILCIANWFFQLQHSSLLLLGINIYEDELEQA